MKNGASLVKIAATWLFVLMIAITAAIVTIAVVNGSHFAPQNTVQKYFDALKAGDGGRALGLLNARVPGSDAAVLDGAGLAKSQEGLTDLQYAKPVPASNGQSKVTVSYKLNEEQHTTDFFLTKEANQWLFFNTWKISPATLPVVQVSVVNAERARINGIDVAMPSGKNSFAVFYPGNYTTSYESLLFAAPAQQRKVTSSGSRVAAVALNTAPTPNLVEKISSTIKGYLDNCAKQPVLMPTDCPLSANNDNRVTSPVKWSIVKYPEISVTPYSGRWILAPLNATAQVEFDAQDLFTGNPMHVKDKHDFAFTARLAINGTNVSVTPVVNY